MSTGPISFSALDKIDTILQNNKMYRLLIEGHTDHVGTFSYNKHLSEQRAQSVSDYLVKKRIDLSRLISKGYGYSKPIGNNLTDLGKGKNRRVHFILQQ